MEPMTLRLMVNTNTPGLLEAQLLELDIVVAAKDQDGLIRELQHAIEAHYHIARAQRRTPFIQLIDTVPQHLRDSWDDANAQSIGSLFLDEEIADALASVLRAPTPIFTIRETCTRVAA